MTLPFPCCGDLELLALERAGSPGDAILVSIDSLHQWVTTKMNNKAKVEKANLKRTFKTLDQIREVERKPYVTIRGFLSYVCQHPKEQVCQAIIDHVIMRSLCSSSPAKDATPHTCDRSHQQSETQNITTHRMLYTRVSKLEHLLQLPPGSELHTPSLQSHLRPLFDQHSWDKVKVFEHHYSMVCLNYVNDKVFGLDDIANKEQYLSFCEQSTTLGSALQTLGTRYMSITADRKKLGGQLDGQTIIANGKIHRPEAIEKCVRTAMKEAGILPGTVACIPGVESSEGITLLVEQADLVTENNNVNIMLPFLKEAVQLHQLQLSSIHLVPPKALAMPVVQGIPTHGVQRLTLAEKLLHGQLDVYNSEVFSITRKEQSTTGSQQCQQCFEISEYEPLSISSFNPAKEWCLFVPLPIQLLFERMFVNHSYIKRCGNKGGIDGMDRYVSTKTAPLLQQLDGLLSLSNHNHLGLLQEMSTLDLLMNSGSITNIFEITNHSKLTRSLTNAETMLRQISDPDRRLFWTYEKNHRIIYQAVSDTTPTLHKVNIKDCHVVYMVDNLIRLVYRRDAGLGQKHTETLRTLPVTLEGLPKDSLLAQACHKEDCTKKDGHGSCDCKIPHIRSKDELARSLLERTHHEKELYQKLQDHLAWGIGTLLSKAMEHKRFKERVNDVMSMGDDHSTDTADTGWVDDDDEDDACLIHYIHTADPEDGLYNTEDCKLDPLESSSFIDELQAAVVDCAPQNEQSTSDKILLADHRSLCGVKQHTVNGLLKLHPPPFEGKDDDIQKVASILYDLLRKLHYSKLPIDLISDRIIMAPDHKIAQHVFTLMGKNERFRKSFVLEFPVLHLIKSRILCLLSAFKSAGLAHLLTLMATEDEDKAWQHLSSVTHITTAVKRVTRLCASFQLCLLLKFLSGCSSDVRKEIAELLEGNNEEALAQKFGNQYKGFLEEGCQRDVIFRLHVDMLTHMLSVAGLSIAEKLGGPDGYALLTSCVKDSSLLFSFVTSASSYAVFQAQLLLEHVSCDTFHQNLKKHLFSHPFKSGGANCAIDTHRELDHIFAARAFRGGSNLKAALSRMSCVDVLQPSHDLLKQMHSSSPGFTQNGSQQSQFLGHTFLLRDMEQLIPVTLSILDQGGFDVQDRQVIINIYDRNKSELPSTILDCNSLDAGRHLLFKFLASDERHPTFTHADVPCISELSVPNGLKKKLEKVKSVTINRLKGVSEKPTIQPSDKIESARALKVRKGQKLLQNITSGFNTCLALVTSERRKLDCKKATGLRGTVKEVLLPQVPEESNQLPTMCLGTEELPAPLLETMRFMLVEAAGAKFKAPVCSGEEYLRLLERKYFTPFLRKCPRLGRIVWCEEKYSFTPDAFKASTHANRVAAVGKKANNIKVSHLRGDDSILSLSRFDKRAITQTLQGKKIASTFLAQHVSGLQLKDHIVLDVDSELELSNCGCAAFPCEHKKVAYPVRALYGPEGFITKTVLKAHPQSKGEAELAVADHLASLPKDLCEGDTVVILVTSADHDLLPILIHTTGAFLPKRVDGSFLHNVAAVLVKAGRKYDVYNITNLTRSAEMLFRPLSQYPSFYASMLMSVGGNDFLHKIRPVAHQQWLQIALQNPEQFSRLFKVDGSDGKIVSAEVEVDIYAEMVKFLLCPATYDPSKLSYTEARQLSIKSPSQSNFRNPERFIPPLSAVRSCVGLINSQCQYILTIGQPLASLPDFLGNGGLFRLVDGTIKFDLGDECSVNGYDELLTIPAEDLSKAAKLAKKSRNKERNKKTTGVSKSKQPPKAKKGKENTPTISELSKRVLQRIQVPPKMAKKRSSDSREHLSSTKKVRV